MRYASCDKKRFISISLKYFFAAHSQLDLYATYMRTEPNREPVLQGAAPATDTHFHIHFISFSEININYVELTKL